MAGTHKIENQYTEQSILFPSVSQQFSAHDPRWLQGSKKETESNDKVKWMKSTLSKL